MELVVGSVPSQVLRVETRLENPTLYHVMESQKRQVRHFLQQNPCHYPDGLQEAPHQPQQPREPQEPQQLRQSQEVQDQSNRHTTCSLPMDRSHLQQPEDQSVADEPTGTQQQQASAPAGFAAPPPEVRGGPVKV